MMLIEDNGQSKLVSIEDRSPVAHQMFKVESLPSLMNVSID